MQNQDTTKTYRIPVYGVQLIREKGHTSETRKIVGPRTAAALLAEFIGDADRETFVILLLDTKNQVRGIHTVSTGDLASAIVHPREVFKAAILASASAIIAGHNHPSGDPTPSPEDIATTRRLAEAGTLLGIDLLDHIVLGDDRHVSLKDKGLF